MIKIIKSNYYVIIRMDITFELFTQFRWSGNQNQPDMRTIIYLDYIDFTF